MPLLAALAVARRFRSHARFSLGGPGGDIEGAVAPEPVPGGLILREIGELCPEGGRPAVRTTNAWRLDAADDGLRLSHLRFGDERPVPLVELEPAGRGRWTSCEPNVCGADRYAARLALRGGLVRIVWTVEGPAKRGRIATVYVPQ